MASLTEKDIRTIIQDRLRKEIERTEEEYEDLFCDGTDESAPEGRKMFKYLHEEYVEWCTQQLNRYDYSGVEFIAQKVMEENGIELSKGSSEYKRFLREVLKSILVLNEIMARRAEGDYLTENKILPPIQVAPTSTTKEKKPSLLLGEVIERYVNFQMSEKKWNLKSRRTIEPALLLFKKFVRDIPILEIEPDHGVKFKEFLRGLPANHKKIKKFKDKSIEEISMLKAQKGLSEGTIYNNIGKVVSLFNWSVTMNYIEKNPMNSLIRGKKYKPKPEERREAFNIADLHKLFFSEKYLNDSFSDSFEFWLPLLGIYTGGRIDELCQLHVEDVKKVDDIWVIDINDNEEKKLKNESSKRFVPLHPFLLELGFHRYAEKMKIDGHARVFPELVKTDVHGYSHIPSTRFTRFKRKAGISEKTKVFHSFRHTVATFLTGKDVIGEKRSDLLGHETGADYEGNYHVSPVTAHYSGKRSVKELLQVVKELDYGIDLTHLKKSRFACPE